MKIYCSHPISGMSYQEVSKYYWNINRLLNPYYTVLSPMTGKEALRTEIEFRAEGYDNPVSTNRAIVGRDKWMVQQADVILVNLNNATERVSIGSVCEMAWAYHLGKHIILILDKEEENIHLHAFILEMADIIFQTSNEAIEYLINLTK